MDDANAKCLCRALFYICARDICLDLVLDHDLCWLESIDIGNTY